MVFFQLSHLTSGCPYIAQFLTHNAQAASPFLKYFTAAQLSRHRHLLRPRREGKNEPFESVALHYSIDYTASLF